MKKSWQRIRRYLKKYYLRITESIAFIPSVMGLLFALIAILILRFDATDFSQRLKDFLDIQFNDANTARSITVTLLAGILSLTVFSFSMVMVMLGQAISNSSPKIMDMLIEEKRQQIVLGCFIGTILYCLILTLNISSFEASYHIPTFSFFFGILLGVFNIFLFIYFINSVAQSIKPYDIISRIHHRTKAELKEHNTTSKYADSEKATEDIFSQNEWHPVSSPSSGYLQDVDVESLVNLAKEHDAIISIDVHFSSFVIKDTPLLSFSKEIEQDEALEKSIESSLTLYSGEFIEQNFNYGFQQLMEVAIKALSPGINDPGTALLCIDALSDCLALRMQIFDKSVYRDEEEQIRLITKPIDLNHLLHISFNPIRFYGKSDTRILARLLDTFGKLAFIDRHQKYYRQIFQHHSKMIIEDASQNIQNSNDREFINVIIGKMNKIRDYFDLKELKPADENNKDVSKMLI